MADLKSAWLKLHRAERHLDELARETKVFQAKNPFAFAIEPGGDDGQFVIRVTKADPLPLRLALIAGDAVHNLRSALEHAVWELAGPAADKQTQFPVLINRSQWAEAARINLDGLTAGQKDTVASFQPFVVRELLEAGSMPDERDLVGDNILLLGLNRLEAIDKHHLLLQAFGVARFRTKDLIEGGSLAPGTADEEWFVRLIEGEHVLRFHLNNFPKLPKIKRPSVTFSYGDPEPPGSDIWDHDKAALTAADLRLTAKAVNRVLVKLGIAD